MTCIVAIVDEKGTVHFASDSLVVNVPDDFHHSSKVSQTVRGEPKVFRKGNMLFGYSGAVRMGQLLQYEMEIPEYAPGTQKLKYLVSSFVPAVQACFTKADYDNGSKLGGNILLGLDGELFHIGEAFHLCNPVDPYYSVGKAQEVAIGSLHTTGQLNLPIKERLLLALQATERHTCVVSGPFWYISSEMEEAQALVI